MHSVTFDIVNDQELVWSVAFFCVELLVSCLVHLLVFVWHLVRSVAFVLVYDQELVW